MATPNDFVQLVGTDTPNAPGAAYLCSTFNPIANPGNPDSYRLHFNLPEGTQRYCGEAARIRMPRTDLVMITRFSHATLMGLPGYVLTSQDAILTGKKLAVTGKLAMASKGSRVTTKEGAGGDNNTNKSAAADGSDNANAADSAAAASKNGLTNKQRKAMEESGGALNQKAHHGNPNHLMGRVFLVGGPVDAIRRLGGSAAHHADNTNNANSNSNSSNTAAMTIPTATAMTTPLEAWWKAMVSMYFHYRVQGVVDLAFIGHNQHHARRNPRTIAAADEAAAEVTGSNEACRIDDDADAILFTVALTSDRINGVANEDYYVNGPLPSAGVGSGNKYAPHPPPSSCCDGTTAGHKRSRSTDGVEGEEDGEGGGGGSDDVRSMGPLEAVARLSRSYASAAQQGGGGASSGSTGASQMMAFDTTTSSCGTATTATSSGSVASYWCRFPPPPPRFDAKVAKEVFGVTPGPKYAALKQGQAVESDTMKDPATGGPLMVTLADVSAAAAERAAAATANGSGAAGASQHNLWTNMLVLDGDDAPSILRGLERALAAVGKTLAAQHQQQQPMRTTSISNVLGRLTLVLILCPANVDLSSSSSSSDASLSFTDAVTALFNKYNSAAATSVVSKPRFVASAAGLLSADTIEKGWEASASDDALLSAAGTSRHPLPPTAFPTALAHRFHLNALAGDYFPLERRNAGGALRGGVNGENEGAVSTSTSNTTNSQQPRRPLHSPHPLALTPHDKVWWPYSIIYRVMDGGVINVPKVAELNAALAHEAREVRRLKALAEGLPPPVEEEDGDDGDDAPARDTTGGDQDPPLRYPDYAASVEMLSEHFKAMVVGYGHENALADLTATTGPSSGASAVASSISTDVVTTVAPTVATTTTTTTTPKSEEGREEAHQPQQQERTNHMLFLGTGSAVPSKYRNVSGLIVGNEVAAAGAADGSGGPSSSALLTRCHPLIATTRIVCDFGEGSLGQWAQFLGPAESYDGYGGPSSSSSSSSFPSYGLSPLELALVTVRTVFISHNHADHVLGIFGLLDGYVRATRRVTAVVKAWQAQRRGGDSAEDDEAALLLSLAAKPLLVVCPRNFRDFLSKTVPLLCQSYAACAGTPPPPAAAVDGSSSPSSLSPFDVLAPSGKAGVTHLMGGLVYAIDLEPLTVTTQQGAVPIGTVMAAGGEGSGGGGGGVAASGSSHNNYAPRVFFEGYLRHYYGAATMATIIPVDHPAQAHALFFRNSDAWSWCYSGDTRPWPLLNSIANCSVYTPLRVLVHECTFDDDLQNEAVYKKHSTLSEALGVGVSCGAEHVLLNHFSQRYPKIPPAAAAAAARLRARKLAGGGDAVGPEEGQATVAAPTPSNAAVDNDDESDNACTAVAAASSSSLPVIPFTFSFDGMLVPYGSGLHSGDLVARLPLFQWLLDEYDGWAVGTSQRLRGRREAAANYAIAANKDHQAVKEEERRRVKAEKEKEKLEKQAAALERHKRKELPKKSRQQNGGEKGDAEAIAAATPTSGDVQQ